MISLAPVCAVFKAFSVLGIPTGDTQNTRDLGTGVPSPVPELSFLLVSYRGWTRAAERRVQDNLQAHAQNEPIKNYQVPTSLLASMCRAMPFSARALKENIFFDVDIVIKNIKT